MQVFLLGALYNVSPKTPKVLLQSSATKLSLLLPHLQNCLPVMGISDARHLEPKHPGAKLVRGSILTAEHHLVRGGTSTAEHRLGSNADFNLIDFVDEDELTFSP